jgi:hypothetical protein
MAGKKSPLLKIERVKQLNSYRAIITKHQWSKLPEWAASLLKVYESWENPKHVFLWINAKDELQAMMRFNQLWDGLPKKGPNDA